MTKVYLAGPMSGIPQFNFPMFDAAAAHLRDHHGFEVVSPAELDDRAGYREAALASPDGIIREQFNGETWGDFLARDVKLIADQGIEAIVVLPGWEGSRGARLETFIGAGLLGLPVWDFDDNLCTVSAATLRSAWAGGASRPVPLDLHDSEHRVTDEATGGQKGKKLTQIGALDPLALIVIGRVAGMGAEKYAAFNYLRGYDWSLSFNAMMRHALLFWSGEDRDPESGLNHMAHAAWMALSLVSFSERGLGSDDRYRQGAS